MAARGWGGDGELLFHGYRVSVLQDGKSSGSNCCITTEYANASEIHPEKMVNFMFLSFATIKTKKGHSLWMLNAESGSWWVISAATVQSSTQAHFWNLQIASSNIPPFPQNPHGGFPPRAESEILSSTHTHMRPSFFWSFLLLSPVSGCPRSFPQGGSVHQDLSD